MENFFVKEAKSNYEPDTEIEKYQNRKWLRALEIARILFDDEGYDDIYLQEIMEFIKRS